MSCDLEGQAIVVPPMPAQPLGFCGVGVQPGIPPYPYPYPMPMPMPPSVLPPYAYAGGMPAAPSAFGSRFGYPVPMTPYMGAQAGDPFIPRVEGYPGVHPPCLFSVPVPPGPTVIQQPPAIIMRSGSSSDRSHHPAVIRVDSRSSRSRSSSPR